MRGVHHHPADHLVQLRTREALRRLARPGARFPRVLRLGLARDWRVSVLNPSYALTLAYAQNKKGAQMRNGANTKPSRTETAARRREGAGARVCVCMRE